MDQKALSQITSVTENHNETEVEHLLSLGEYKLLQGHFSEATQFFNEVEREIKDTRPDLLYRIGLAYFEYGSDEGFEGALSIASKKLRKTHFLAPNQQEVIHTWGNILCKIGEYKEDQQILGSAIDKYEKAIGLGLENADLFWDYGVAWYHIGNLSGEAHDLQKAMNAFQHAIDSCDTLPPEFWADFAVNALLLYTKIKDISLIGKAINSLKHALYQDQNHFDHWSLYAEALQLLYLQTHDEDHFAQANEAFEKGAQLEPHESDHFIEWAKFLLQGARKDGDLNRIRSCLEKCHQAYSYDCENATLLAVWAEALALLGQVTDKLDLIYEAENKIEEALEIDENDPEVWHSLGMCFCSFGKYFSDFDYYYQAIEKFQTGLSIDRSCDQLWHAMANTYSAVGLLEENIDTLIQSFKFYEKAIGLSSTSTRHFNYANALAKVGEFTNEEKWFQQALYHYEQALAMQKNAVYLHPDWLFSYASTLDLLGDFHEDEKYYTKAIEILSHVLMVDPDFPQIHHRLALVFCHLGELLGDTDTFYRAIHHFRLALKRDEDNDSIILEWGVTLIHIAQHTPVLSDIEQLMVEAEQKLIYASKMGNIQGYYNLCCLYSLLGQYEKALHFLQKANTYHSLPPLEDLLADDWLDGLRTTEEFQEFLSQHPRYS